MWDVLIRWSQGHWALRPAQLELAASRVAEVALDLLLNSGRRLQFAHVRPAVARGYLRVHAAQAVRRSMGHSGAALSTTEFVAIERLALTRLTDRLMCRPRTLALHATGKAA